MDSISKENNEFEIVLQSISEEDVISIGVVEEMHPADQHPGMAAASIGYYAVSGQ